MRISHEAIYQALFVQGRGTKATTSALNDGVNERRWRRSARLPSTFFRIRTPSTRAHAHI